MAETTDAVPVRMAELLASLSMGIDLGFGQPMGHILRQCQIVLRLGELVGLDEDERATTYYAALLVNVGCHSDAYEQARWFGDDIALKATKYGAEPFSAADMLTMLRLVGSGGTPLHRIRTGLDLALHGRDELSTMVARHAELARSLGEELGLRRAVLDALGSSYERWDGRGWPGEFAGESIPLASRIVQLAEFVEVAHRTEGPDAALVMAKKRRATQFDPSLVDALLLDPEKVLAMLDDTGAWDAVIDAEPTLSTALSDAACDDALRAIGRFVDLKSPWMAGHSQAVADLAAGAGRQMHLSDADVRTLCRAGLVHSFGRLGVSNAIWDKPGPLTADEWERVRLHPYYADRMLRRSPAFASAARVAVQQAERLDGSGYPSGASGAGISPLGRVLAAVTSYQAMGEPRPYRDALAPPVAAAELRADVKAGRLDADAVEAVLAAAGHRVPRRREGPAGLTAREVDVLRLLARGMSNRQVAARLVISPKTAGNHVEHIYTKLGVTNRAGASLWAMQQGLLPEEGFAATD